MNSNEPEVRQRFTLAHEIGHLVEREHLGKDVEFSKILDKKANLLPQSTSEPHNQQ
ncbi:ImmA/IrrE family metallo-endopeptidase [Corynebacterium diphtheriae]|uniref:ImmA/IrrE family metallo-endopeptidase n=1 Tax=Corynebacterium diphtheriae TaxID=1717 RepID=UPI003C12C228